MAKKMKTIATNRKAYHYYEILETLEAGIELSGSEVKSCRLGKIDLRDSFAYIDRNEIIAYNIYIAPYAQAGIAKFRGEPRRKRKLLLHRQEINRLIGQVSQKGFTLIPLELYFKNSWAKVKLGLAKRKKIYDKREILRQRDLEREMRSSLKEKTR
jgi:SsrA-binding protein